MLQRQIRSATLWAVALSACAAASFFALDRQTREPVYWLSQLPPVYLAVEVLVTFGKAGLLFLALAALWLWGFLRKSISLRRAALLGFAAQAAAGALVWALKLNIPRERPYVPFHRTGDLTSSFYQSFPSADAAAIFAFAFAVCYALPRLRSALLTFAALVAAQRVFRLAHYPSDVLAGAAAGAAGWAMALALASWRQKRQVR